LGGSWLAGISAFDVVDTRDSWRTGDWEANVSCILVGSDPRDYFRRDGVALLARVRAGSGRLLSGEWRAERIRSLASHPVWNVRQRSFHPNPPSGEGIRRSFHLAAARGGDEPVMGWRWRAEGDCLTPKLATRTWRLELGGRRPLGGAWRGTGRLLVAGSSRDAPPEWRHALGGIDALRGLAFKELRGEGTLLVSTGVTDGAVIAARSRLPLLSHLQLAGIVEVGAILGRREPGTPAGVVTSAALGAGDLGGFARLELARRVTTHPAPWRLYLRFNRTM
jgi:hypothetical protein